MKTKRFAFFSRVIVLITFMAFVVSCAGVASAELTVSVSAQQNIGRFVAQINPDIQVVRVVSVESDKMNVDYAFIEAIVPGEMSSKYFILTKVSGFEEASCIGFAPKYGWKVLPAIMGGLVFESDTYSMYQIVRK